MANVFVYGTLMKGHGNHRNFLSQSEFLGSGEITGYAMYEVSSFPGIVPESGENVKGEIYEVDQATLRRLDYLEGEGSLYNRKQVEVLVKDKLVRAWTYVWNNEVKGTEKVNYNDQPWRGKNRMPVNKQYVWYACYGSNLLKERFMHYIKGGVCRFNGASYSGCKDKSEPLEDRPCIIKHELYFGNSSGKWDGGGVAFLTPTRDETVETLGRMFLISEEQFKDVQSQEGFYWYNEVLDLGMEAGYPIKTFTHSTVYNRNKPSMKYINVVREGLHETYPDKSDKEISYYINDLIISREEKLMHALFLIRKNPQRIGLFELISSVSYPLNKAHEIIQPLIDKGYIRQYSRDHCGPFDMSATYHTEPSKRQEIDQLLKSDAEDRKLSLNHLTFSVAGKDDKMLACVHCLTFYKEGTTFCRECLSSTFEIDAQIADVIFNLNGKGYITTNCCAGHSKDHLPYITFKVDMSELSLPTNFKLEYDSTLRMIPYYKVNGITKKKMEQTIQVEELESYKLDNLEGLRTWANGLPMKRTSDSNKCTCRVSS